MLRALFICLWACADGKQGPTASPALPAQQSGGHPLFFPQRLDAQVAVGHGTVVALKHERAEGFFIIEQ